MVKFIKEQYPKGTRIRLNSMEDPYAPIAPGTEGEVDFVDDLGSLHMKWSNGRSLALIPGEDSFSVLPPKLTTLKLYMPLTADFYEPNEYGDLDDNGVTLEGAELRDYAPQISAALLKERMPEEAERGLMHWYHEADSIERKVHSAFFTVESRDGQLWGVAECRVAGELTGAELETLKSYLEGQAADGWAEGFEQREIHVMAEANCTSTSGTRTNGASRPSRSGFLPSWRQDFRRCASPRCPALAHSSVSSAARAVTIPAIGVRMILHETGNLQITTTIFSVLHRRSEKRWNAAVCTAGIFPVRTRPS